MFESEDQRRTAADEEFLRLFLLNQRRIYSYILTLLPRAADADDLLQETSMTLWRKRGEFAAGTSFGAWACAVAYNLVRNFRVKHSHDKLMFDEDLLNQVSARVTRMGHELDRQREVLEFCLAKLPPRETIGHRFAVAGVGAALASLVLVLAIVYARGLANGVQMTVSVSVLGLVACALCFVGGSWVRPVD